MTDVPSNLVPVRLTSLTEYVGGSTLGYTYYVLGGVTYKVQIASLDIGTVSSVDASGGTTGLTFSGGPITSSGTLTLGGTLAIANGGTGSATATLARAALLPTYAGNALKVLAVNAGATDVEWVLGGGTVTSVGQTFTGGLISVGGSPITTSGTLALTVAGTSGGIPYFSSAAAWASSAVLAANALMVGGGAGAAPATVTTGTGVLTALGINVGSAGAFVAFNGALGTPSSGTLTNCTGYPVSGLAGLGTGVAAALAINIGSAGAPVLFNGAGGTPSSMTATNLSGTAAALNIGGNAATATSATTATNIAGGAAGQIPRQTGAGATGFTTATFPTTAGTSGNVLTSDGTNWLSSPLPGGTLTTTKVLTSGTGATYTPTAGAQFIRVTIKGGGGGGSGTGTASIGAAGAGGTTSFNGVTAIGGAAGAYSGGAGGTGGSNNSLTVSRDPGSPGGRPALLIFDATQFTVPGGNGGGNGGGLGGAYGGANAGVAGITNSGGGGGGGGTPIGTQATLQSYSNGFGGGEGESATFWLAATTYTYTVGVAGTAGTAGTSGAAGGAGGSGVIYVEEFY